MNLYKPIISALILAAAAFSIANYFALALDYGFEAGLLLGTLLFILWFLISYIFAKISNSDFKHLLFRDSFSFLPFLLLLLWPLSEKIPLTSSAQWGNFDTSSLAANLFLKLLLALALILFITLKSLLTPKKVHDALYKIIPKRDPKKLLVFMGAIYFISMFLLSFVRFLTFKTPAPDLWIFNQAMWNTLHGNFMVTTRTLELGNQVLLGDHFFLILLIIIPLYSLFQHPLGLYLIETAFIAIAALPLYWIAKNKLESNAAGLIFAAALFLFPALQFIHLSEFQPVAFTIPFLLFAYHYLQENKLKLFALFTGLALSVRETQAPVIFMFGLYIAFVMKRFKLGAVVSAAAVIWFLLVVTTFIPALGVPYQYIGGTQNVFPNLGESTPDIISNVITNPMILINEITSAQDIGYLALLFLPVCFLSLLSPAILIPGSVFALNLLSGHSPHATIYFQYNAELIAFLFIAAVLGAHKLIKHLSPFTTKQKIHNTVLTSLLAAALICSTLFGPTPLSLLDPASNQASFSPEAYAITPHHELLLNSIASIPQEASVSTDSLLAAHLSSRAEVYYFPLNFESVDYILIDTSYPGHDSNLHPELIQELKNSEEFKTLVDKDHVLLLKRIKGD